MVRSGPDVLIVQHRVGFIIANAGVDRSNVTARRTASSGRCCCRAIRMRARSDCGRRCEGALRGNSASIINDSFGRPWRRAPPVWRSARPACRAQAICAAGPICSARSLEVSVSALADEIAAAASLLMGQGNEGRPIVIVAGLDGTSRPGTGRRAAASSERGPVPVRRVMNRASQGSGAGAGAVRRHRRRQAGARPRRVFRTGRADGGGEHRRRLRASGSRHLTRYRHPDVHAGRDPAIRRPDGAATTRPGPSWRRWASSAARPGSSSATAIWRCMWSARGGCAAGEQPVRHHRRLTRRARHFVPHPADDGRPGAHAPDDTDEGPIDFQDYFVAAQCRAGGARDHFAGAEDRAATARV